jgi:putative heme-binding domain-containing protein
VQLLAETKRLPESVLPHILRLAGTEPDVEVRCQLAAGARRLPAAQALPLTAALLQRAEDGADPFIPLLCWWAIETHCATEREAVLASIAWNAASVKEHILPRVMRRFATTGTRADLLTCARLLALAPSAEHQKLLMTGFEEAFKGRALPPLPEELVTALARTGLASRHLRVRSREPAAVGEALKAVLDPKANLEERLLCARLFGEVKLPESVPVLVALAKSDAPPELRRVALTSLLLYDDPALGQELASVYSQLPAEVQPAAQNLLTSRAPWALAFLQLIEKGEVSRETVPPDVAARLRSDADPILANRAKKLLVAAPVASSTEHRAAIERLRGVIAAASGDPYKGEPIFAQRCASCHLFFHKGGRLGPDLTTYQRDDLGTLLTSIIDPNAEIREGFRNHIVTTNDGRTVSGLLTDQDDAVLVIRGFGGQDVSLSRADVRDFRAAGQSLMPEGLLQGLSDQELRDFFAYLRISQPFNR